MTRLKGGELLLDAIPLVERLLGRPIEVFFAGDGPQRAVWEARKTKAIFTGWISQHALRGLNASLLVMPSVWPEPFGLSALELGMPAAAFRVGGIPEWLRDGVNGHLADSLDAGSLARAIHACLENEAHFHDLQNGAFQVAKEFSMERHLNALLPIFQAACQ
jgi:glycosyltransferase involved in cell wall biosynthesis